ncbi:S8 family serine peptidase [Mycoplasmopsis agassizii]|uniref:S8 family serine peptidase n=1 Tax=Mycoplasmopsis agassizii TaxID=33922 RepID=UPI00352910E1
MSKALFNILNTASLLTAPFQTVSPVVQKTNDETPKLDFLYKIQRLGYNSENLEQNINEPVEILIRTIDKTTGNLDSKNINFDSIIEQYKKESDKLVTDLLLTLLDVSVITPSLTTPYITVRLRNRKNLEANLIKLAINNNIVRVTSYENVTKVNTIPLSNSSTQIAVLNNYTVSDYNKRIYETVGLLKQIQKDNSFEERTKISNKEVIKVGIFEAEATVFDNNPNFYMKDLGFENLRIHYYSPPGSGFDLKSRGKYDHADKVASVLTGRNGVDSYVTDIYSTFASESYGHANDKSRVLTDWINKMDWMIVNGVKVINNSWKSITSISKAKDNLNDHGYNEQAYYLDYIASKYGITNVFAAGNDNLNLENRAINSATLAQNAIVVGSTTIDGTKKSDFSEYEGVEEQILTKPLVVAPGEGYAFASTEAGSIHDEKKFVSSGTSYSAPLVTGMITTLFRHYPSLYKDPAAIMAILSAGAKQIKGYSKNQTNGLNNQVGAGLVNYEKMDRAAKNAQRFDVKYPYPSFSREIELKVNDNIDVSIAWLNNGGYNNGSWLETRPVEPENLYKRPNWISDWSWLNAVPFGFAAYLGKKSLFDEDVKRWEKARDEYYEKLRDYEEYHNKSAGTKEEQTWESSSYSKSLNGNEWFLPTDVDLKLMKFNENTKKWDVVATSESKTSNVEFIRFQAKESGKYKIKTERIGGARGINGGWIAYAVN